MKRLCLIAALFNVSLQGQCVMCYRTAHAQNEARSRVMNWGILILGAPPLLILGGFVALLVKRSRKEESVLPEE